MGLAHRSPEGKGHLCVCSRCAAGFREFLKARGLTPGDFGKRKWDQVAPARVWRPRNLPKPKAGSRLSLSHPVVCGGRLYVRYWNQLLAYDIAAGRRD